MRFNWILVLLSFSSFVWSTEYDSLRKERIGSQWVIIHQVDPGETLYSIARRYQADLTSMTELNGIQNNSIRSGQLIQIPFKEIVEMEPANISITADKKIHMVLAEETLFAISRKYGVKPNEIKAWNNLITESLSIGQQLIIEQISSETVLENKKPPVPFDRALKHYIQSGENMEQIADKRNVSPDSLRHWNNLSSDDLKIGQILWYRPYDRSEESSISTEVFGKHVVEGIARQIEDMVGTDKYLALHKKLPTGTLLEIRNLMNNKKVFVRVIGQLPSTGINQDVLVRLTPISFKRLGILDARTRIELTYYDE